MAKEITINNLLDAVGADNISVQFLDSCMTGAKLVHKGAATEVRFETDAMTPDHLRTGDGRVGIVCWVDRSVFSEVRGKLLSEGD